MKTFNIIGQSRGGGQIFIVTIVYTVLISESFFFGGGSIIKAEQNERSKKSFNYLKLAGNSKKC